MKQNSIGYINHDSMQLLLPWYVNRTLTKEEHERVEEHLRVCITCRSELHDLRNLAQSVRHAPVLDSSPLRSFSSLMQQIESAQPGQGDERITRTSGRRARWSLIDRLSCLFPARRAMIAATAMVLALIMPTLLWTISWEREPTEASYRTLAASRAESKAEQFDIRVMFAETLSPEQRRRLVGSVAGTIVEGPDSKGVFLIRIGSEEGSDAESAKALESLRQDDEILFAEPALPPGRAGS